jgi:C4-dicarboxylate transporter DctM subunit
MSSLTVGFLGFAAILLLIALRVPIALALGLVAIGGMYLIVGWDVTMTMVRIIPYDFAASWELSAIPMFLLMGTIAYRSGMTASMFDAARVWLGRLPGGLAVSTNFACAGFGAASGSSLATTVAMGRITLPEMLRSGYHPGLAAGVVACAGTLGSLIPPSVLMIIYGIFAEVSVAALFMAGIIPGILTAIVYAGMIMIRCKVDPTLAPLSATNVTWGDRWRVLAPVWPLPLLILGVVGTIYSGIATPTEAGALGASLATLIALVQGRLSKQLFRDSVWEALSASAVIFFIGISAALLTRFMALSGMPTFMAELFDQWALEPLLLVLGIALVYLVLGCFLDPLGIMLLTLPVVLPVLKAQGLDLIWFGILLIKYLEVGLMTPPVGLNVYCVKTLLPQTGVGVIFKGVSWFLVCEALIIGLIITYPAIALWLPQQMS